MSAVHDVGSADDFVAVSAAPAAEGIDGLHEAIGQINQRLDRLSLKAEATCAEHSIIIERQEALTAAVNSLGELVQLTLDKVNEMANMAASIGAQFANMNPATMLKSLMGGGKRGN